MDKKKFVILRRIAKFLNSTLCVIMIAFIAIMVVIMFSQIVLRVVLGTSLIWAEKLLRIMFIWICFMGIPTAIYSNELTRFDLLQGKLSPLPRKILESAIFVFIGVIMYIVVQGSLTLVTRQMSQAVTSLPFTMGMVYLIIPITGAISVFFIAVKLLLLWLSDSDFVKEGNET